jgi:signal transduction histidine kinase/CheY-like chemotaxis protein
MSSLHEIFNTAYQLYLNSIPIKTVMSNYLDEILNLYNYKYGIILYYDRGSEVKMVSSAYQLDQKTINDYYEKDFSNIDPHKLYFDVHIDTTIFGITNGILSMETSLTQTSKNLTDLDRIKISNLTGLLLNSFNEHRDAPIGIDQNELLAHNFTTQFLNSTSDGIIITDSSFNIKVINKTARRIVGATTSQEMISRDITDVISNLKEKMLNSDPNKSFELIIDKEDEIIILDIVVKTLGFQRDNYYLFLLHDITEKEINHQKDVIKKKNDFIAFLSHELRNPLQSVLMSAKMISIFMEKIEIEELIKNKFDKYLLNIQKSSDDMKKIINDVLDLGKIDSGEMKIESQNVNIKELIVNTFNKNIDIVNAKKLKLEYLIMNNVPLDFTSDQLRLSQILNNLVSNAIKYSHKGNILIKVIYDEKINKIKFIIKDEGIGIKQEDKIKLFKQYSQLNHKVDMTIKQNSTGLGLIISQKLVKLMGGVLEVNSEYGKGSEFYFSLPATFMKKISSDTLIDLDSNIVPLKGSLLLVEDHLDNLELLKEILENFNDSYGFRLTFDTATSGIGAVQACNKKYVEESKSYDLIFMDINMEHMDGSQACRIIKKRFGYNKIIALTGNIYTHQENNNHKYKCFDDVILKPYNDKKLLKILLNNLKKIEE